MSGGRLRLTRAVSATAAWNFPAFSGVFLKEMTKNIKWFKTLLALGGAVVLLRVVSSPQSQAVLKGLLGWIEGLGPWGALVFIALYILATVLFVPGSILTLGAGALYGVAWGSVYVSIGSTIGATAAFLIGRYAARDWVARRIEGNTRFQAVDRAVGGQGFKIVGLMRLSPVFPFNLLNYALGTTRVGLRDYFFGSWMGMMPGTVMFVYLGSLAGDLARLGVGGSDRGAGEWILLTAGLAATVAVTVYITRISRAELEKSMNTKEGLGNA